MYNTDDNENYGILEEEDSDFDPSAPQTFTITTYDWIVVDGPGVVFPVHAMVDPGPEPERSKQVSRTVWNRIDELAGRNPGCKVVMAWDGKHNRAFRNILNVSYKHGRVGRDNSIRYALAEVFRQARTRGYVQIVFPHYEADDGIATLARELDGQRVLIVSEDRDLYQLITATIHQHHLRTSTTQTKLSLALEGRSSHLEHTYRKSIMGDAGDNIRGLPGVGEKVAHQELSEYPELVRDCVFGSPDWTRLSANSLKAIVRSGMGLVHPVKCTNDKFEPLAQSALRAVVDVIQETYRAVALEDSLDVDLSSAVPADITRRDGFEQVLAGLL